ncbi:dihydroorotate dehydrogenase/oxidoreductase, FAD-binding protein [Treponema pedis str. T A4]|uniref:Dihydroorotate dehydrogenase/oxidoreductase, FAD-binding protein n=2 Tax=Treponema pedis TaxID=409322 RepID=S6A884_9SPIR|nr:dihydroorotate dehydrogenase/oxidoreductase, FAD-binding protein [Treponema pedis str. T A4]
MNNEAVAVILILMKKLLKNAVLCKIKNAGDAAREGKAGPLLATVSGVLSTKPDLIRYADERLGFAVVTTKSFQIEPNEGNREPIICEPELGCFGNSVGLKNPGMKEALKALTALKSSFDMKAILNVSLSASSPEDFITLIQGFEPVADCMELNFSCPHAAAGYGASIGCDKNIAADYVRQIKKAVPECSVPIFIKLTPNVENIGEIAAAVIAEGADGITAINTAGPKIYIEPDSGKPILQNKLGGKGGMSGSWIFLRAVECISEIRKAVGPGIPIIGMGGVASGAQAAELLMAGADIVGIGSACGMLEQDDLKPFFDNLVSDALSFINGKEKDSTSIFLRKNKALAYSPFKIIQKEKLSEDIIIFVLDGSCKFEAGQFVFLWLPGIGEKPFSLAETNPMSLIIKRRGVFTEAMFKLKEGETVYMRGPYGKGVQLAKTKNALLVAGGTGIAVLPSLAEKLKEQGTNIFTYIGTSEDTGGGSLNSIEQKLVSYGNYKCVADNGCPARVLQSLEKDFSENKISEIKELTCYLVGPMIFMRKAAELLLACGVIGARIFLSLEMNTMCGIGICGECACGNILTCKKGTFVRFDEIYRTAELKKL